MCRPLQAAGPTCLHGGKNWPFTWNQQILPANFHIIRNIFFSSKPRAFPRPPEAPPRRTAASWTHFVFIQQHKVSLSTIVLRDNCDKRNKERGTVRSLWQARTKLGRLPLSPLWSHQQQIKQQTTNKTTHWDDLNQGCCRGSLSSSVCLVFFSFFFFCAPHTNNEANIQTNKQTNTAPTTLWVTVSLHRVSFFPFFSIFFSSPFPPTHTSLRHTSVLCNFPAVWRTRVKARRRRRLWTRARRFSVSRCSQILSDCYTPAN